MASLHFAIRAFVSEGHDAPTVLNLLGNILDIARDKRFATVLCGYADVPKRQVMIANAGHLPPLIISAGGDTSRFVTTDVGPPIGVPSPAEYRPVTFGMEKGSILLAYTDGLVERRGENLDDGLQRLQSIASNPTADLDTYLTNIIAQLTAEGSDDDTALLALRWTEEST